MKFEVAGSILSGTSSILLLQNFTDRVQQQTMEHCNAYLSCSKSFYSQLAV